jgi:GalNAc-alpha-(1->4)-GalNAc-alpha-(1->3)-diNAcBac-PP-undecaprenol alpha-1,4-N-acetyl-D-galactosaminyltransferase
MGSDLNQGAPLTPLESSLPPKGRLTFVIYKMSEGGAQRHLSNLVNFLSKRGWSITVLTFDDGSSPSFYKLHLSVQRIPLSIMRQQKGFLRSLLIPFLRPWILRTAILKNKPDIVIPFIDLTNILTLISTIGLEIPVLVAEMTHPKYHKMGKLWGCVRAWIYRRASCVVVQTEIGLSFFSPEIQCRSKIIPNPVIAPVIVPENCSLDSHSKSLKDAKTLIAMGRLSTEKGFDLLLKAFVKVVSSCPDWKLIVWGEGDQRKKLEDLSEELGLKEKVSFPGITHKPYEKMKESDLFVLSSQFEGFPNVLCEAMACGLPVVSFNCPSGPGTIIRDGYDGILVPPGDVEELAVTLVKVMNNTDLRESLSKNAGEIIHRFSVDKVVRMWEELFFEYSKNDQDKLNSLRIT